MVRKAILMIMFLCVANVCCGADILAKPITLEGKLLTKTEQVNVKEYLGGKIFKELLPAKNDYKDKDNRGTVEYNNKKGTNMFGREVMTASNYSRHKVVIPDGTTIKGVNFAQAVAHTEAITGKNLTFINCNLTNVEKDASWTLISSINQHSKYETIIEEGKTYEIQYLDKDGKWVENQRSDITPIVSK